MANVGKGPAGYPLTGRGSTSPSGATFLPIGSESGLQNHGVLIGADQSPFRATTPGVLGQVLTSQGPGADPIFFGLPSSSCYFQANLTAPQTVAAGSTAATIIFDTTIVNVGLGYNSTSGQFIAPAAGFYSFAVTIYFNNLLSAVGASQVILGYTGNVQSLRLIQQGIGAAVTNNAIILTASWNMPMAFADTIQIQPFADGSGSYDIFGAPLASAAFSNSSVFSGFRLA